MKKEDILIIIISFSASMCVFVGASKINKDLSVSYKHKIYNVLYLKDIDSVSKDCKILIIKER